MRTTGYSWRWHQNPWRATVWGGLYTAIAARFLREGLAAPPPEPSGYVNVAVGLIVSVCAVSWWAVPVRRVYRLWADRRGKAGGGRGGT